MITVNVFFSLALLCEACCELGDNFDRRAGDCCFVTTSLCPIPASHSPPLLIHEVAVRFRLLPKVCADVQSVSVRTGVQLQGVNVEGTRRKTVNDYPAYIRARSAVSRAAGPRYKRTDALTAFIFFFASVCGEKSKKYRD